MRGKISIQKKKSNKYGLTKMDKQWAELDEQNSQPKVEFLVLLNHGHYPGHTNKMYTLCACWTSGKS
jgi:hypothetical protein